LFDQENDKESGDNTSDEVLKQMMRQNQKLTQEQIMIKRKREAFMQMQEHANELFNFFNLKSLEAMIKLVRSTLEKIRRRILQASKALNIYGIIDDKEDLKCRDIPVFKTYAVLAMPNLIIQPSIDEMQHSLNKCIQSILNVSKNLINWTGRIKSNKKKENLKEQSNSGINNDFNVDEINASTPENPQAENNENTEDNENNNENENETISNDNNEQSNLQSKSDSRLTNRRESRPTSAVSSSITQINYFKMINENKEIAKLITLLSNFLLPAKNDINSSIERFKKYEFIWQKDRDDDLREFLKLNPQVTEFEAKVRFLAQLSIEVNEYPEQINVSITSILLEKLKIGFDAEIKIWKSYYGNACNQVYKTAINEILVFIEDAAKKLQREIKDLDDIRAAMTILNEIRDNEIRIDMAIMPIEESYAMIQKHHIDVPREEIEKCDTLRYNWQKLKQLTIQKSTFLLGKIVKKKPSIIKFYLFFYL